jgi:hypothetical protein
MALMRAAARRSVSARSSGDGVTLVRHAPHDGRRVVSDVLVDQEKSGPRPRVPQRVQQRRRPVRVRAIVEGQINRRGRARRHIHVPQRLRGPEGLEQKRERRDVGEAEQSEDGDEDPRHTPLLQHHQQHA